MAQQPLSKVFMRQSWRSPCVSQYFSNSNQSRCLSTTIPRFAESEIPSASSSIFTPRPRRPRTLDSSSTGTLDPESLFKKHNFPGISRPEQRDSQPSARPQAYPVNPRLESMMERATANVATTIEDPNHHLHVYSHRHNCHITLTGPDRNPLLSVSAGKLGFRHSQRGSYDAAYQLAVYTLTKMVEKGIIMNMEGVELVLRGHGAGREAVVKAIVGSEGRRLKPLIVRVTDATRTKFGGTKGKNVRRL